MTAIAELVRSPAPGTEIHLFRFDATSVGGEVYYFVQAARQEGPAAISFGGQVYQAIDIEFEGVEVNSAGSLPTPKLRIANTNGMLQAIINTYGDLCGCELRRVRTFARFLDGEPEADPTAFIGPDVFRIERKLAERSAFVEWELSADIDQEGKLLPGRVIVRDTCLWRYRRWGATSGTFDYSKAQCPYVGAQAYDVNNLPTTPDKDQPARNLSCCKTRFGAAAPLPFGGFPGAARARR